MNQEPLKNLLPKFVENLKGKSRSPATILAYGTDLAQLLSFLQKKNKVLPQDVIGSDLEAFRDTLTNDKYTPKTVSRKLNAVKTYFRWLKLENIIASDPSKNVSHPKIESSAPKFLSKLEYRALRDVVRSDIRIAAIVELILQTGIRISEVANLKVDQKGNNEITVEAYATQPERRIPLNSSGKMALENYLNVRPKTNSQFVFISKNGKPLAVRNIRAAIDRYMQKADISGYSVNDLRTTFIVENLKAGLDLIALSQIVGHKRLSTTERYLELAGVKESGKKQTLQEL